MVVDLADRLAEVRKDGFGVRSGQNAADCQSARFASSQSSRLKMKKASTYGWQYASRTPSRIWVAWSGAGLLADGWLPDGSPPVYARTGCLSFSRPVYS